MILLLLIIAIALELPLCAYHYRGYWNGRYDPQTTDERTNQS